MPTQPNADDPNAQATLDDNPLFSWSDADQPIAEEPGTDEPEQGGQTPPSQPGHDAAAERKDSPHEAGEEPVAGDQPAEPEPEPEQPESDQEPELSDSDQKRFAYWQSQHDKVKNELDKMKSTYGEVPQEVVDLARNIVKRPDLLDAVESHLSGTARGSQTPSATRQKQEKAVPERPTKPQKPQGYDHYEAVNDPESESFRYRAAMQEYEEQLSDYLLAKEEAREAQRAEREQQASQQAQQQALRQELTQSLRDGYDFNDQQINDFFEVVNQTPELDDLVTYYRMKTGTPAPPKQPPREEQIKARKKRSAASPPPNGTGASPAKSAEGQKADGPFVYQ